MTLPFPSFHNYHQFGFKIQKVEKSDNAVLVTGSECLMSLSPFTVNKPFAGNYPIKYQHTSEIKYATTVLTNASFALHLFEKPIPEKLEKEIQILICDSSYRFYLIDGARGFASHKFTIPRISSIQGIIGSLKKLNEFAVITSDDINIYKMTLQGCNLIDSQPIRAAYVSRFQNGYLALDQTGIAFIDDKNMVDYVPKKNYDSMRTIGTTVVAVELVESKRAILHIFNDGDEKVIGVTKWINVWDVVEDYIVAALDGNLLAIMRLDNPDQKFLYKIPAFPTSHPMFLYSDIAFGLDSIGISIFSQDGALTFYIPLSCIE